MSTSNARRQRPRDPLDLFYALCDASMPLLSANGWKVVAYVARRNIEAHAANVRAINDPVSLLKADVAKVSPETAQAMAKHEQKDAPIGLELAYDRSLEFPKSYAPISLQQFCDGRRDAKGKRLDGGTGLPKSSVTDAVNEAVALGILERKKQTSSQGKTLPSRYRIRWEKVFELVDELKKHSGKVRCMRSPGAGRLTVR